MYSSDRPPGRILYDYLTAARVALRGSNVAM